MNFEKVWSEQESFNNELREPPTNFRERGKLTETFALGLMSEIGSLLRHVAWRPHRRFPLQENRDVILDILADIFKYWLSLCQCWGFSQSDIEKAFWRKSMVVRQRYAEEFLLSLGDDARIAIIDIDGVLCDYFNGFLRWYLLMLGKTDTVKAETVHRLSSNPQYLTSFTLGLTHEDFEKVKREFRTGGAKRTLPVYDGAKEFLEGMRKQGYKIILMTSRPFSEYPSVHADTLAWLHHNNLQFDALWWSDNKSRELIRRLPLHQGIALVVDDDPIFLREYANAGIQNVVAVDHQGAFPMKSYERLKEDFIDRVSVFNDLPSLTKEITVNGLFR